MHLHDKGHKHHHKELVQPTTKIFLVVLLNFIITLTEVMGGILSRSLALLSDSLHNFSDTFAVLLSYIALKISERQKDRKRTFGYKRAQIIVAFLNSSALLIISLWLIWKAIERFRKPEIIDSSLMLIIAVVGLLGNFFSVLILKRHATESLNIKSSYLHLLSDTASSVGVVIGGVLIKLWNISFIDPILTILISLYIIGGTWDILKRSVDILMQSAPDLDFESIKKDIENIKGVRNIHHVHAWYLDDETIHFEAHIDFEDMLISEAQKICTEIENILKEKYGISHITLQAEVDKCARKELF